MVRSALSLAHKWAHRATNHKGEIEGKEGNTSYRGDEFYSYSACIAKRISEDFVLVSSRSYSVTTARHISFIRESLPSNMQYIDVEDCKADSEREHTKNWKAIVEHCNQLQESMSKAKSRKGRYAQQLQNRLNDANNYRTRFLSDSELPLISVDGLQAIIAANEERERALHNLEIVKREARDRENASDWKAGKYNSSLPSLPVMFRLSIEENDETFIESSHGATFPAKHAKRAWQALSKAKQNNTTILATKLENDSSIKPTFEALKTTVYRDIRLGDFTIESFNFDGMGTIKAGCHTVTWEAIVELAKLLELIPAIHPEI